MKRTIAIVILGICLLGGAGWGVFTTYQLQEQEDITRNLEYQYDELNRINDELNRINTDFSNQVDELLRENTELLRVNTEIGNELHRLESELQQMQQQLEAATFELGEDMLTKPRQSANFDCDDSALYMYHYFTSLGYQVRIVYGNLQLEDESYLQANHVWVWVSEIPGGGEYAYDWGYYYTDEQHSWGYVVSYQELLEAALRDQ